MGFYRRYILPKLLDLACGAEVVRRQRRKVVPLAAGRVLEIGIGSGLNLAFYDPARVDLLIGLDPAEEMLAFARRAAEKMPFTVEYLALEGERIPLEAQSVDTVVVTYTLCTIPDAATALDGMRRVSEARRPADLLRTRPSARCGRPALAASPQSAVEPDRGRLQSRPRYPGADRDRRVSPGCVAQHVSAPHPPVCRIQLLGHRNTCIIIIPTVSGSHH